MIPVHHRSVDRVLVPEQRAGFVDASLADEPADACAADDEVLVAHRIDLFGLERVAGAELPQQRKVPGAVVAEEKIGADPHLRHVQPVGQHDADERLGIPARQLGREAHDRRAVHAGGGQRLELLRLRHQQRRRLVRPHDARRMRIEGHDHRGGAVLAGDAADSLEDLAVAAMDAVEIPQRKNRVFPARRAWIFRKVDDVHDPRQADPVCDGAAMRIGRAMECGIVQRPRVRGARCGNVI